MDCDYNKKVGLRIFNLRKDLKMSRAELGKILNLHESTIKRYEDGCIKALDIDKIKDFSNALNTTPAYLMGWEEEKATDQTFLLNDQDVKLIKNFKKLNDTGKNKVIDYAEDLSSNPQYQIPSPVSHFAKESPLLFAASAEDRSPENIALMESEFDDFDDI